MFKAYFDESWDARQEKILVIGGMIGRHEEWAKIEWPWKRLLDSSGVVPRTLKGPTAEKGFFRLLAERRLVGEAKKRWAKVRKEAKKVAG